MLPIPYPLLLQEELSWIKSQYFGSISQKQDAATVNRDQPLLFNEAIPLSRLQVSNSSIALRGTP